MSPCDEITTLKMSPNLEVSTGGQIGTDSHEQQRVATSRGIGSSGKRRTETGSPAAKGCGKAASWKSPQNGLSHCAWKSAHTADFHFTHSLDYYRKIKNVRPRQKGTFLLSVDNTRHFA